MTTSERLSQLADKDQQRIERYINQILNAGHKYKRAFSKILTQRLSELLVDDRGRVLDLMTANRVLTSISNDLPFILNQAGVTALEQTYLDGISKRLRTIDTIWRELGQTSLIIGESATTLPVVALQTAYIVDSFQKGLRQSRLEIMREVVKFRNTLGVGEQIELKSMVKALTTKAGVLPQYAGAVANTSLMAVDRAVRREQGQKGGLEYAKYMGPLDSNTRPFCVAHVGRVETWEYWDTVSNGTALMPVSVYGAGYNCRHDLLPFDLEWENS